MCVGDVSFVHAFEFNVYSLSGAVVADCISIVRLDGRLSLDAVSGSIGGLVFLSRFIFCLGWWG